MIKTQVIIEQKSRRIIDVQGTKRKVHDFKLFKDTLGEKLTRPS